MITEDYVSFETAKLLKEKGFDEPLNYFYNSDGIVCYATSYNWNQTTGEYPDYSCPTLQMAMKWLREVHNLFIFIIPWEKYKDGAVQHYYEIRNLNDIDFETLYDYTSKELDSYEKTCEEAIKYCLKNLI